MLNHQICQSLTADEDYLVLHVPGIFDGGFEEVTRSDEDPFVRMLADQGTDEALDLCRAHDGFYDRAVANKLLRSKQACQSVSGTVEAQRIETKRISSER
jgi:hypothetical protein